MGLYSIADMIRMILHHKGWTLERLRIEIGVSVRQRYKLQHLPEFKFRGIPKGAKQIQDIFLKIYPDPAPASVRPLAHAIEKIAWLKRNKRRKGCPKAMAIEVAHWLTTLNLFVEPRSLTEEERFTYHSLKGHVYFALASDVDPEAEPEVADVLRSINAQEAWSRAAIAFEQAFSCMNFNGPQRELKQRYRHVLASAALNLGASAFMAYRAGVPEFTRERVVSLFNDHVRGACEFFYHADPHDPRAPFNMTAWFSHLEDLDGCRTWFARLIKADPEFADVNTTHAFMRRPMSEDPDFAFLIEHLNEILPAQVSRAAA
jgi:hypothetical protein